MAEVTGMTPAKITQEITNVKSYVDGGLSQKADITYVDQKDSVRGNIPNDTKSLDELEPGTWGVSYYAPRSALGLPTGTWGVLLLQPWGVDGTHRVAIYTDVGTDSRAPKMWVAYKRDGVWSEWYDITEELAEELADIAEELAGITEGLADITYVDTQLEKYGSQVRINEREDWGVNEVYTPGDVVTHNDSRWVGVQSVKNSERKNLIKNPRFANNRYGWTAGLGVSVSVEGTTAILDFTDDKPIGVSAFQPPSVDVSAATASGSYTIHNPGETPVSIRLQMTRGESYIYNTDATIDPGATVVAKMENVDVSMTDTVRFYISGGPGGIPAGTKLFVSKPILETNETVGEYFDGSFNDKDDKTGDISYGWEGEENNSTSLASGSVISPPTGVPGVSKTWVSTGLSASKAFTQFSINERGDWEEGAAYTPRDIVTHDEARWVAQNYRETETRTNHVINPRFTPPKGWISPGGVSRTMGDGKATLTTSNGINPNALLVGSANQVEITGGVVSVAMNVHVPEGAPEVRLRLGVTFYPTTVTTRYGEHVTIQPGETKRLTAEGLQLPAGKTHGIIALRNGTSTVADPVTVVVSEPIMELAPTIGSYFDGDMADELVDDDAMIGTTTYTWDDTGTNSVSRYRYEATLREISGTPGTHPAWVLTGRVSMSGGPTQPVQKRLSPPESIPDPENVTYYISDLSPDGLSILGVTGWHIRVSTDDAKSWKVVSNFSDLGMPLPRTARWLPDGDIILNTSGVNDGPQHIYRSKGADWGRGEPTWEHVFTFLAGGGPAHGWSWSIYENIVLVAAYGSKDGVDNARHVYLSTDMGRSFRMVHELPNEAGIHQHGVAWDPFWDRIWLTHGDSNDAWKFSDDLGETWHFAKYDEDPGAAMQAVGIYPTKDAILFASDGTPNGLWRIPRSQGKHTGFYEPEAAFIFNDQTTITHLCHAIYQRSPDHPVLFGYGAELKAAPSRVIATHDGYEVCDIWEDPYITEAGRGLRSLVGPTARGNLIWEKQDSEHNYSGRLRYTVPWSGGY